MRFYNFNPEKKDQGKSKVYIRSAIIGLVLGVVFITLGIGLKTLIIFLVKYWVWTIGIILALLFIREFLSKRRRVKQMQEKVIYN